MFFLTSVDHTRVLLEENVISGQRNIRIFGKRFMESEMTSILVQGVGPEQGNTTKFFENHQNA